MESPLLDLSERTALVTGAGQGVGREIALHFAKHNARAVVINDLFQERADAVADEIAKLGTETRALPIAADITDCDTVNGMFEKAANEVGSIDILVNNAGVPALDPKALAGQSFVKSKPEDWEPFIKLNLYGTMYCTHAAIGGMIEKKYGKIITVISDAGRVGERGRAAYSAAKAGAAGFSRTLALEVGRKNITVNCIALGTTLTPTTEGMFTDEIVKRMLANYTIPRLGQPSDAAAAVLFLASDASSWITGQTLPVNGGYSVTL